MNYRYLIPMMIFIIFIGCSKGNMHNRILPTKEGLNQHSVFTHSERTVTVYVHGFKSDGHERNTVYGNEYSDEFSSKLRAFTGFPSIFTYNKNNFSNLLIGVEFYGSKAPSYYIKSDKNDIEATSDGIPKYSLIVAKFIKHIMKETKANKVNIVSVSMGSLITRYMIEKNLENLASDRKIEKWITVEGVLRGNYALTKLDDIDSRLVQNIIDFFNNAPETEQMKYQWIEKNLTRNRAVMDSIYYKNILLGQISLTDSEKDGGVGLKYIFPTDKGINLKHMIANHGGFQPNDGYQLVQDTYCSTVNTNMQVPSHTLIHTDHVGVNTNDGVFASLTAFLEARKRVRITLIDVTVNNLHEKIIPRLNEDAEIVFENKIFSKQVKDKFFTMSPISERNYDSGLLPIHYFQEEREPKRIQQVLFDDFVLNNENKVQIKVEAYELDRSFKYKIEEFITIEPKESLGSTIVSVDLVNGVYKIVSRDWSGYIKVEVVEM